MYPEGFEFLATTPIEFRYLHTADEPHVHYRSKDVIFKQYPKRYFTLKLYVFSAILNVFVLAMI